MNQTHEPDSPVENRHADRLLRLLLWCVVVALVIALAGCTSEADGGRSAAVDAPPMRLLFGGNQAVDSASVITDFAVDQVLRQVIDSIPAYHYLTINYRDSLADLARRSGGKGIELEELGGKLDLDGVIFTQVARFGRTLALRMRVVDPSDRATIYQDVEFRAIRYRDSSGTPLLGPALYEAVRGAIGRWAGIRGTQERPVLTQPVVFEGVVIPGGDTLHGVSEQRTRISAEATRALADFALMHFPSIVALGPESRDALYRTAGLGAVNNTMPLSNFERRALYGVDIDTYLLGEVAPDGDSVRIRLELRRLLSASADTLVDAQETVVPMEFVSSSTAGEESRRWIDRSGRASLQA